MPIVNATGFRPTVEKPRTSVAHMSTVGLVVLSTGRAAAQVREPNNRALTGFGQPNDSRLAVKGLPNLEHGFAAPLDVGASGVPS